MTLLFFFFFYQSSVLVIEVIIGDMSKKKKVCRLDHWTEVYRLGVMNGVSCLS